MLQASSLVPSGFAVETVVVDGDNLMIAVRPVVLSVRCPACEAVCDRVHSQYRRTLADLPAAGPTDRLGITGSALLLSRSDLPSTDFRRTFRRRDPTEGAAYGPS